MEDSAAVAEGTIVVTEWVISIIESSQPFLAGLESVLALPHLSDMLILLAERIIKESCPGMVSFVLGSNTSKRLVICDEKVLHRNLLEEAMKPLGISSPPEAEITPVSDGKHVEVVLSIDDEVQEKPLPSSLCQESSSNAVSPGTCRPKKPDRQFYIAAPKRNTKKANKIKRRMADQKESTKSDASNDLLYQPQPPADSYWEPLEKSLLIELFNVVREVRILKPDRVMESAKLIALEDTSLRHILEAYDFPASFEDNDIRLAFQNVQDYNIKWINDTSALLLFRDAIAASSVLAISERHIKVRPMSLASPAARIKVKKASEFVLPYKERPQTLPTVARRMISSSLGLKAPKIDSEELILIKAKAEKKSMKLHPVET